MILSAALALMLQAAPTLAAAESLSPEAAGALLLAGRAHGPVVAMVAPDGRGLPPGTSERQLFERPVAEAGGCVRKRWTVTFARKPGEAEGASQRVNAWAGTEIALPDPAGCPADGYVRLNLGLTPAQGLPALKHLDALGRGEAKASFTCTDQTASDLCGDPKTLHQKLARLSAWALTPRDGQMVFWLGAPGQTVTEVRYAPARPERVAVERRIPPPF